MISFFIPIKKVSRRIPNKNTKRIHNYKFGLTEIKLKHLYKKNRMEEGSEPYVGQKINLIKKVKFN